MRASLRRLSPLLLLALAAALFLLSGPPPALANHQIVTPSFTLEPGDGMVRVHWTVVPDGTHYDIQYGVAGSGITKTVRVPTGFAHGVEVSHDITGLYGGDAYAFRMRAVQPNSSHPASEWTGSSEGKLTTQGVLNTSFGTLGKVTTTFGSGNDYAQAVAVQSDGKIVAAGYSWTGSNNDFVLARYNADGTLDTSFGTGGKVATDITTSNDYGHAVAMQSDGKIVVAGYGWVGSNQVFALARYNADGTLDTSFGTVVSGQTRSGKVTTDIASGIDHGNAVAVQPDGKIVVAGTNGSGSGRLFALARYTADGALDTDFSSDGKVTTDVTSGSDQAYAVAVQPDGKIVVAGSGNSDFALARYTADGDLDTSFSSDGKVTTPFGSGGDHGRAVAVQPDGKIVVAGFSLVAGQGDDFALARYTADGDLDTSFSSDGKVTTHFGSGNRGGRIHVGTAVAMAHGGKIVVAGYGHNGSNNDFALARYTADGDLDTSFRTDGKVTTQFGSGHDFGTAVAVQPDGKIVVAGYRHNGTNNDFALARYAGQVRQSSDATLSGLEVDDDFFTPSLFDLTPPFASATYDYSITLPATNGYARVTPTTSHPGASVTVNGTAVTSGERRGPISLDYGSNTINVVVTAEDGAAQQTYTVTIDRALPIAVLGIIGAGVPIIQEGGQNALQIYRTSADIALTYNLSYTEGTASLADDLTSAPPTTCARAKDESSSCNIRFEAVDDDLVEGTETFTVTLLPGTGYTVGEPSSLTWSILDSDQAAQSADASLSGLTAESSSDGANFSALTLDQSFAADTTSYTKTVPNATTHVRLTPTVNHGAATVTVKGTAVTSGSASGAIALGVGANAIAVVVTAEDTTTTKTYTVTVTRQQAQQTQSSDASLTGLSLSDGANAVALTPSFAAATTSYTARVGGNVTSVSVTPTWTAMGSGTPEAAGAVQIEVTANSTTPNQDDILTSETSVSSSGSSVTLNLASSGNTEVHTQILKTTWDNSNPPVPSRVSTTYIIVVSRDAQTTVPGAPTNLTPTGRDGELEVTWTAPGGTVTGYDVEYKTSAADDQTATTTGNPGTGWVAVTRIGPLNLQTITGLANGTAYDVRVRAKNANGDGPWATASGTPTATLLPTVSLSASPNPVTEGSEVQVKVTLSAALSSDVVIPLTLTRGTAESGDYGALTSVTVAGGSTSGTGTLTTAQDDDTDDETFTVALGDLPSSVQAGRRASVTVTIIDDQIASPTRLMVWWGDGRLDLNWYAPNIRHNDWDPKGHVTGYDVQYKTSTAGGWTDVPRGGIRSSQPITGLANGTAYDVRVRAVNDGSNSDRGWPAGISGWVTGRGTPAAVSGAIVPPHDLGVSPWDRELDLSWRPLSGPVTGYDVAYKLTTTPGARTDAGHSGTAPQMRITSLTNGAAYDVRVRAKNGSASSIWLSGRGTPLLPALTGLRVKEGDGRLDLRWTGPPFNVITGYDVAYKAATAGVWTDAGHSGTLVAQPITGLTNGVLYDVRVRLRNDVGDVSAWTTAQGAPSGGEPGEEPQPCDNCATGGDEPGVPAPEELAGTYSVTASASAVEGEDATLTLTLSEAAPAEGLEFTVTAGYGHGGGAPATADDVGGITSPVTVAEGSSSLEIAIPTVDDAVDEEEETFTVTVAANAAGWVVAGVGNDTATMTIRDDDTAGVTVDAADPLSVTEGETGGSYTVTLTSRPLEDVTITAGSSDEAKATVFPAAHTITPEYWDLPVIFSVNGLADDDSQDESVGISHRITSADGKYAAVPVSSVAVAVTDDTPPQEQEQKDYAELIAQMYEWRDDPQWREYKSHTDRWDRALLAFGETVEDGSLTPMTAAEAQDFADSGMTRWVEVAEALREIDGGTQQQQTLNRSPTVSAAVGDVTIVNEGGTQTVSLSGVFDDADGDALTITAGSSDEAVATVSVDAGQSTLTLTAQARGTATVTVTANDGRGGTVSDTFTITVKAAPVMASAIADVTDLTEGATQEVSLSGVFSDADGDSLTISAASSDTSIATVSVAADQSTLTVAGVSEGTATTTVIAQDSDGNRVSDTFDVSVAQAPEPEQKDYSELIAQMYQWRNDPQWVDHKSHTDRWDRALLAFGETVEDGSLTPMTAAAAQGYADESWGSRWVPVAKALWEIEGG